ncbi:MAG: hypothetical protein WCS28_12120, partial [Thiomicrospira sp.]
MAVDPESLRNGTNWALKTKHFNFTAPGWGLAEDLKMSDFLNKYNPENIDLVINLLKEALHRFEKPSLNANGGKIQLGGAYWRLQKVVKTIEPYLAEFEGEKHARFLKDVHSTKLKWHPFDGSVEPTANKRYLVMHYDNAPQDKTTLEHDYEFSVMYCEQVQTGEK